MSKGKQATLFQSWGNKKLTKNEPSTSNAGLPTITNKEVASHGGHGNVIDLCDSYSGDDDDEMLAQVSAYKVILTLSPLQTSLVYSKSMNGRVHFGWSEKSAESKLTGQLLSLKSYLFKTCDLCFRAY